LEFKREVYDYWECDIQGMAEVEEDEQVHMVQSYKVQMKRREQDHGIKQEGNYCYINLCEEDEMEAAELENQKREKKDVPLVEDKTDDQNREENVKKEEKEDNKDDPTGEEGSEDEKAEEFPIKPRNDEDEQGDSDKDVGHGQEHLKEESKEKEIEEDIKNEEKCQTWEEDANSPPNEISKVGEKEPMRMLKKKKNVQLGRSKV